jgi:hypothetical protein
MHQRIAVIFTFFCSQLSYRIRCVSLEVALTSLYSDPADNPVIRDLPRLLAALPAPHFSRAFVYAWKTMKRHPELFQQIFVDIVSVLLSLSADRSQPELHRRAALFFLSKVMDRFPDVSDVVSGTGATVVAFILPSLENAPGAPDFYAEARGILGRLRDLSDVAPQYAAHANPYVASCFSSSASAAQLVKWLRSEDAYLIANALQALDAADATGDIGRCLIAGAASAHWRLFIRPLTAWCQWAVPEPGVLGVLERHPGDGDCLLCEATVRARTGSGVAAFCERVAGRLAFGDERLLEALAIVAPAITPGLLARIVPQILARAELLTSVEFCVFAIAVGQGFAAYVPGTVDALLGLVDGETLAAVDVLQNLVDVFGERVNAGKICDAAFRCGNSLEMMQLLSSVLPFVGRRDADVARFVCERIEEEGEPALCEALLGMAAALAQTVQRDIAMNLLEIIPLGLSKAVSEESDALFARVAALFSTLLKRFPADITALFFRIQKIFPRYSQPDAAPSLRAFSLMTWTDFVIYGPNEHILQYRRQVADDLKQMIRDERDEEVRVVALSACAAFFANPGQSDAEVDQVLKRLWLILNDDAVSEAVHEMALSGFAQLLQTGLNERNFPARTQQLLSQLPLRRSNGEADTIYGVVYELSLVCVQNPELMGYLSGYEEALKMAIQQKLVTTNFLISLQDRIG